MYERSSKTKFSQYEEDYILAPKPTVPCQTETYIGVATWEDEYEVMEKEVEEEVVIGEDEAVTEEEEGEDSNNMETDDDDDGEDNDGDGEDDKFDDEEEKKLEVRVRKFYWIGEGWSETDPDDGNIGNELIDLSETDITSSKKF
ncbi:hypothetical protein Glove_236g29 [Diversispora epigaea]|uniref:Uncharacterized protein n=1 Tax=Diversispora epigaea TaxID=1348612 RepID=A0A397IGI0_9GLOM|nr:hypothetical protein Glove_236g29 [Diversispora epigaea]